MMTARIIFVAVVGLVIVGLILRSFVNDIKDGDEAVKEWQTTRGHVDVKALTDKRFYKGIEIR